MRLPGIKRPAKTSALGIWANQIMDALERIDVQASAGALVSTTTRGTFVTPTAKGAGASKPAEFPLIDQWDPTHDYFAKDLAFCDSPGERDDGTQAGLYQCILDIAGNAGNDEPSVDAAHWKMIARGHWDKLTIRSGDKYFLIDTTPDKPRFQLWNNAVVTDGSVTIDLADIPASAGNKVVKLQETQGKDELTGSCKTALFLRSDWF